MSNDPSDEIMALIAIVLDADAAERTLIGGAKPLAKALRAQVELRRQGEADISQYMSEIAELVNKLSLEGIITTEDECGEITEYTFRCPKCRHATTASVRH